MPVLVGALLAVATAGPLGAGQVVQAVVEPRTTITRTVTIPPGAFAPGNDDIDFSNAGHALYINSGSSAAFRAPLFFEASTVTIKKITLFAWDDSESGLCVHLYRATPNTPQNMGGVCSTEASASLRKFTNSDLTYRRITGAYGPYLSLGMSDTVAGGVAFYGVRITYTYETDV